MRLNLFSIVSLAVACFIACPAGAANELIEISTAEELASFAEYVTSDNQEVDAVLLADIDYTAYDKVIGASCFYCGTFDGHGHKITYNLSGSRDYLGLFNNLGGTGVIKNLIVDGTLKTSGKNAGAFCGQSSGLISHCASYVTIMADRGGDSGHGGLVGLTYDNARFEYCLSAGKIESEVTTHWGGFVGWNAWGSTVVNSSLEVMDIALPDLEGCNAFVRGGYSGQNNYYLTPMGDNSGASPLTVEQLSSGEGCFMLNGDQSNIQWFQTLEADPVPVPFATSKRVYATGHFKCDGVTSLGVATYSNEEGETVVDEHNYVDGVCTECHYINPDYCELKDGAYQIGEPSQLNWFCQLVASGKANLNARLVGDIDFTSYDAVITGVYEGTFDGNGHTLTIALDGEEDYIGFFSNLGGSGVIKNLVIDGTITTGGKNAGGFCGQSSGLISHCVSYVTINCTREGDSGHGGFVGLTYNDARFEYCLSAGRFVSENTTHCGGFVGWNGWGTTTVQSCLEIMEAELPTLDGSHSFVRGGYSGQNNYYLTPMGDNSGASPLTVEQLSSGEGCFMLNGDQSNIQWFQTLEADPVPVPFATSKRVYATGHFKCDGVTSLGVATYSNEEGETVVDEHNYVDGVCTECHYINPDYCELKDGAYQIGEPSQLNWFCQLVASGKANLNARLVGDIDFTSYDAVITGVYEGTFDGNGHTLTIALDGEEDYIGFFSNLGGSGVIKNLVIDGTITTGGKNAGGFCGQSSGLISHCVSYVTINCTREGDSGHGGFVGLTYNDARFEYCLSAGRFVSENTTHCGGFVGWNGWGTTTVQSCLEIMEAELPTLDGSHSFVRGGYTGSDNYYVTSMGDNSGAMQLSMEQIASGEACYLMNGDQSTISWYQNIGDDTTPVPLTTHGTVYLLGRDTYIDIHDEASFYTFKQRVAEVELEYVDGLLATASLLDDYVETIESMGEIDDSDAFMAAYQRSLEKKKAVTTSANAYADYQKKVDEVKAYLAENTKFTGRYRVLLETYLNETVEPCDDYPFGSCPYIIAQHTMNTDEIQAETERVQAMLDEAVAQDYVAGTDVTSLLKNASFKDGFNGWEGKMATGMATSPTTGIVGAECWDSTFDMHQTLTDVKPGLYMYYMTGAFRPHDTMTNNNLVASIYAGENMVYMPSVLESYIPVGEASDGINCNLTGDIPDYEVLDDEDNLVGYAMHGCISVANAANAGRSQCAIITDVTDGTLTVGMKSPGTGCGQDWTGFAGIHLVYLGTLEEAGSQLDAVLEGQIARANTLIDYEFREDEYYSEYPNFSQALKDELGECIDEAQKAGSASEKYALIQRFSAAFEEVYVCKMAYISMLQTADAMYDLAIDLSLLDRISEEEYKAVEEADDWAWGGYVSGSISTDEALGLEKLKGLSMYPETDEDGVYVIGNYAQFMYFAMKVNTSKANLSGKLTADITYDGLEAAITAVYEGTFDGQGHRITLDIEGNYDELGLFSNLGGSGVIKNLIIEGTLKTSGKNAGAFCGLSSGLISHCASYATIMADRAGDSGHGGLVGMTYDNARIEYCLSAGKIESEVTTHWGGFVGWKAWGSTVVNSSLEVMDIALPDLEGCNAFVRGGYTGQNNYYMTPMGDNSGASPVTAGQLSSGEVCYKLNGSQADIHWYQTLGEDALPVLDDTHKRVYMTEEGTYTNEKTDTPDGSKENPYVVKTAADLASLSSKFVAGQMVYVVMDADIDMADVTDWKPLFNYPAATDEHPYPFIDFDGKNHVVRNLTCKTEGSYDYPGLFGVLCGNVRNLGIENADIASTGGTGILGGYLGHSKYGKPCYVENVWVTGKLSASGYCGGMFGNVADESHLTNCYANVEVTGESDLTGGIIGRVRGQVVMTNVYAAGSVNRGGGIIGGGFQDATPAGMYTNVVVWNNTEKNFGPARESDVLSGIMYYSGSNFAALQGAVVAWDPAVWYCDMAEGSYPVLKAFTTGVGSISAPALSGDIYDLSGRKLQTVPQKGIYIMNGKKTVVR